MKTQKDNIFLKKKLTFGDGWLSFLIGDSTARRLRRRLGNKACEEGARNLSKIAMSKNMEIRIAVATKPKETALTELSKLLLLLLVQCCCCWYLSVHLVGPLLDSIHYQQHASLFLVPLPSLFLFSFSLFHFYPSSLTIIIHLWAQPQQLITLEQHLLLVKKTEQNNSVL